MIETKTKERRRTSAVKDWLPNVTNRFPFRVSEQQGDHLVWVLVQELFDFLEVIFNFATIQKVLGCCEWAMRKSMGWTHTIYGRVLMRKVKARKSRLTGVAEMKISILPRVR